MKGLLRLKSDNSNKNATHNPDIATYCDYIIKNCGVVSRKFILQQSFNVKVDDDNNFPVRMKEVQEYINASSQTLICNRKNPQRKCEELIKMVPTG